MEDKYEIKFYKNDEEIDIEEIPDDYLNGIIQCCKNEIVGRERMNRVWSNNEIKKNILSPEGRKMKRGLRSKLSVYDDVSDMGEETIDEIYNEISSNIKLYNNRIENIKQTDEAFKKIITSLEEERYSKTKEILKEDFDVDLLNEDGTYKTLLEALAEIWNRLT